MFRVNYYFYETVLWIAKFPKSLREFLGSFRVIEVFLEVWEFHTDEVLQLFQCGILGPIRKKKLLINIKFKKSQRGVQLGAIMLSKKVLDPLQYRPVTKASLINYIKAKKNKSGNVLL